MTALIGNRISPALSSSSCVVLYKWSQSNGIGTNSLLSDVQFRQWPDELPNVQIWDQTKRTSTITHTFADTDPGYLG